MTSAHFTCENIHAAVLRDVLPESFATDPPAPSVTRRVHLILIYVDYYNITNETMLICINILLHYRVVRVYVLCARYNIYMF